MFDNRVQLIFQAQAALAAANNNDPRFEELVSRLMDRMSIDRLTVLNNIVHLAQGHVNI